MSQEKDSSMVLIKLTEATLSKNLRDGCLDDEDFNGNNGEEYLSDEAQKKGFESDRDFAFDKAEKKTKKMKGLKKIKTFLDIIIDALKSHGGSYYENIEYDIIQVGKVYVVAILTETSH